MEKTGMDRRQVLSGVGIAAGAVVAGTVALSSPALADDGNHDNENNGNINGSWLVNRQSDNDPTDHSMAVLSFAAGNVMIVHDINPAGPPFTGTWARQGGHGFRARLSTRKLATSVAAAQSISSATSRRPNEATWVWLRSRAGSFGSLVVAMMSSVTGQVSATGHAGGGHRDSLAWVAACPPTP